MLRGAQARCRRAFIPLPLSRSYAVSVKPPVVYEGKVGRRVFEPRKTYLFNQYASLLRSSSNSPLLFLQHTNFSAPALIKLRRQIAEASIHHSPSLTGGVVPIATQAQLIVMRTSIFGVVLRSYATLDGETITEIANMVHGGLALLSLPSLHPPQLQAIIRAFERAVPPKKVVAGQEETKQKVVEEAPTPGRRPKRVKPVLTPELSLLGALIDGRVFKTAAVRDVAKLPTLDTLRAQLVGLLSSPSTQLAAVLSEASGGKLARTLEGLKQGLEGGQGTEHPML